MKINKKKLKVAVLCGGFEPESYASNLTGDNILKALKGEGFEKAYKLIVDKQIVSKLSQKKPDFAFLSMFCKWGEDGVIQSLLEVLGVPYSGSGVETSALCKNKYLFNRFVSGIGLNSPISYFYGDQKDFNNFDEKNVNFPCIVKAVYQGYSLGTSLIKSKNYLIKACKRAFDFSSKITIEEYIEGNEYTVGIIDILQKQNNIKQILLPIIEIKFKKGYNFQSTEVKDDPNLMEEILPARLKIKDKKTLKKETLFLYKKSGCFGVARFDVRLSRKNSKFYFLENNTCPGILNYKQSDLPKQLKSMGISLGKYAENMIRVGMLRPENKLEQYL